MKWFNRKKADFQSESPKKHEHMWKDMPWYMTTSYSGTDRTASYQIIEPFICITCGERRNKVLEEYHWSNITVKEREEEYKGLREKYKNYLKPRAVVEDMIYNITMVKDPQALGIWEERLGTPHRGCGTSSTMVVSKKQQSQAQAERKYPKIEFPIEG